MILLKEFKDDLQTIIEAISTIINIDAAVFDIQSHLIASTESYLKHKGKAVHAPSIKEVLINGNVLVNKPGYMKSCIGCRFREHCPATIEILNSIRVEDDLIGVITLTSFTKEGHDRITKNTNIYIDILNVISELISNIVFQKHRKNQFQSLEKTLQEVLDLSADALLTIDNNGLITNINSSTLNMFSFCDFYTKSISQLLPESMINKILKGISFSNKRVKINNFYANISSIPIKNGNYFDGAVIRISEKKSSILSTKNTNNNEFNISLNSIKGNSKPIQELKKKIKKIANSSSTILITGETGTGKGLLAKAIHHVSNRSNGPFISVNCASIPESLFESELFGYEEGAFTGAKKGGKPGRFELASGGTLFLDEIGEMPLPMQAKLLAVLQENSVERIGGITSIPVDVKVIAATNKDIEKMIQKKEFRSDLYYRLNVIPVDLPPLRARKDDIEVLANEFLKQYNLKLNKNILKFSDKVISLFMSYNWPGNIRELENIVEYCVNIEETEVITLNSLPERFLKNTMENTQNIKAKIQNIELEAIIAALDKYGWDVKGKTEAAKELGIGLRTLYRRLKNYKK
ncbi:sigma-54 interaction domain-containing protein [Paramaledivibacter caminithermalis]|jgi:transcriptional regulator with PAS, ATPase and Fis domain|uniref:Transcriptional regulator containing PAS, AAA-type ATPase, and DNA-binding Fis domains n=1 Tax=Paramaledivibacter caminithermalis (strain DSM 15212 / CIP 107654 / DViRD3) TaxID=1121301 RepID=A0A1M6QB54_PARC5|nr:sigma 54-interacting transcriptional regulator [Paramaledivibacter caminithermalis]SHK17472.1 Transcriptional regulator containing PAS, AAA-type ATPase, and DNA-binding Fis domains [Paramaledivibacter caminithermalis DSM 15212]